MGIEVVFWYWWVAAIVLMSIEMLSPGFFFLWMGFSAFVTGLLVFLIPLSFELQVFVFAVLSVASVLWWKRYMNKHPVVTDQPHLNQRGAQYVGKTFTLIEAIENGRGKIKVADSPWRVEGEEDCPAGSVVKVIAVNGTIFKVIRVS